MDHQRGSVNCRKSKGIVAQRQTKAQFNKIWLATAQGRIWRRAGNLCWILAPACLFGASPALCTRGLWKVGWVGFKDISSEGAHFLSHHCRRKWDPACISSGIVVLKIIRGISHSRLQLWCVLSPLYWALHRWIFMDGWVIFYYFFWTAWCSLPNYVSARMNYGPRSVLSWALLISRAGKKNKNQKKSRKNHSWRLIALPAL